MTDEEALLYVADKIGIQAQYYLDTNDERYLDALKSYMKTGVIYIDRMEKSNESTCSI